mmetsp:Transcript_9047/g.18521  ORF Transcript_9047/g.18521 Transcript_9047/m.18521 type:complete len:237 (-) Transcript_9047:889-1599(-)
MMLDALSYLRRHRHFFLRYVRTFCAASTWTAGGAVSVLTSSWHVRSVPRFSHLPGVRITPAHIEGRHPGHAARSADLRALLVSRLAPVQTQCFQTRPALRDQGAVPGLVSLIVDPTPQHFVSRRRPRHPHVSVFYLVGDERFELVDPEVPVATGIRRDILEEPRDTFLGWGTLICTPIVPAPVSTVVCPLLFFPAMPPHSIRILWSHAAPFLPLRPTSIRILSSVSLHSLRPASPR